MLHEPDEKLETIGFDTKKDLLISVGDLVDRGTENVECLGINHIPPGSELYVETMSK